MPYSDQVCLATDFSLYFYVFLSKMTPTVSYASELTWIWGKSPHVFDMSDTSAEEPEASHPRRRVRSKRTCQMREVCEANEVGRFFATGGTDVAGKPSQFYCRICRKDVLMLTHGSHAVLRHFQLSRCQAFCPLPATETGWWVLDFEGNPSVRVSWSVRESAFFEVLWPFRMDSIPLPRIFLLTILEPRTPHCQSLLRRRRWLKCCNWAAPTSWFTNCGHNSL